MPSQSSGKSIASHTPIFCGYVSELLPSVTSCTYIWCFLRLHALNKKSHFRRKDAGVRTGTDRGIKREGRRGQKTLYIFGAAQVFSARAGYPALAEKCKGSTTDLTVNVRRMDALGECMPECLHQVGVRVAGVGRTHACPVVSLMLLVVERVFDAFDEQDIKHV
ncbi:hypothetical protein HETIRDRAFT_117213 [Heterobasidion irregulare TC 32-1]|uniref:Uncharacterized protein n=1 Tax=Heterobasidion irregulare (strain TC 32-1) TaxID=747525 RepID=W4K1S3_HETIT|nr:uncharacterized protein HETIRDRAFT_117213 [Heterobasidion irregulare TC 32-1]ETW79679.1 hypothetical protein HETIRDRAFT_117213 [Heterobasidion irregulare TC 32-1]